MSKFRDLLMGLGSSPTPVPPLPNEYQEVEYIEGNGTQYIDTGVSGNEIAEYSIKFDPLGVQEHNYEQYICGDRNRAGLIGKIFYSPTYSKVIYQGEDNILGALSGGILDIKVSINEGLVSNNTFLASYSGAPWGETTFYVFNSHGEPGLIASMRLYELKMYSNSVKIRDFVPCYRKSDNVIGLYDLVNSVFYTNIGTGTFIKGNNV